jgi:hypothetical protein
VGRSLSAVPVGTWAALGALTQHRVRRKTRLGVIGALAAANPVLGYCHASLRDSVRTRWSAARAAALTAFGCGDRALDTCDRKRHAFKTNKVVARG